MRCHKIRANLKFSTYRKNRMRAVLGGGEPVDPPPPIDVKTKTYFRYPKKTYAKARLITIITLSRGSRGGGGGGGRGSRGTPSMCLL